MAETVEAVYEGGVLRPVTPLRQIEERARVTVTVQPIVSSSHPLSDCVGIMPADDAAEMLRIIDNEFEQVNLREW